MRWIDPTDLGASIPNAVQVTKIVRHRTQHKTGKHSRETVYVITDLTSREASPVLACQEPRPDTSPPRLEDRERRGRARIISTSAFKRVKIM